MKIVERFVPTDHPLRTKLKMDGPKWITIHDTANSSPGADAEMHARYLLTEDAVEREVLWHYTVDDKHAVQHLPVSEVGWHAGDGIQGPGNRRSIGIEICENADGDRRRSEQNAAELTAYLLDRFQLPLGAVVQHNMWSGKNCPHLIRGRDGGWQSFLKEVESYRMGDKKIVPVIDAAGTLICNGWLEGNTTVVPVRQMAEAMGLVVEWDETSQTVTLLWPCKHDYTNGSR